MFNVFPKLLVKIMLKPNLDVLKYLMSIMIVMIHSGFALSMPVLRCAVPVFFMISSFLFFRSINHKTKEEANQRLVKFVKRALKLYLFWLILLFPYLVVQNFVLGDLSTFFVRLPFNTVFLSSFPASWYIAAYIIGICIVFELRRHFILVCIIGIMSYVWCCLITNYSNLLFSQPLFETFFAEYNSNILVDYSASLYKSFPVGIIFISLGKLFADSSVTDKNSTKYKIIGCLGVLIGGVCY